MSEILVITPYNDQAYMLRSSLRNLGLSNVLVCSIDSAQGLEYQFVILSPSSRDRSTPHLRDYRRWNVALSRNLTAVIIPFCEEQLELWDNTILLKRFLEAPEVRKTDMLHFAAILEVGRVPEKGGMTLAESPCFEEFILEAQSTAIVKKLSGLLSGNFTPTNDSVTSENHTTEALGGQRDRGTGGQRGRGTGGV